MIFTIFLRNPWRYFQGT